MKKIVKILISIFLTIFLCIVCDMAFFYNTFQQKLKYIKQNQKYTKEKINLPKYFIKLEKFSDYYKWEIKNERPVMNPNSNNDSIVIFGCSYAYGYIFKNEETISYVLSKYSQRPIYNRARNGWGVQHMLYQLKNDEDMFKNIKKPKYVFYVLMDHASQFARLYCTSFPDILNNHYYFTYKDQNGEFIERKPLFNLYYGFSIIRHLYNKTLERRIYKNLFIEPNEELFAFFIQHFIKSNNLIKEKWGEDTKFIILTFEDTQKQYWQTQLENEGIKVIDIAETIGMNNLKRGNHGLFEPSFAGHPNGKLWELLVPKLKEIYPDL